MPAISLSILSKLRSKEQDFARFSAAELPGEISRALKRDALLAWKEEAERSCPILLMNQDEFALKVVLLKQRESEMREANRETLVNIRSGSEMSPRSHWDEIVMFTGPRARRLREVVERGESLGLFNLRPVWIVTPEMVSRLFPLKGSMFDVVIFDEASQLPVECALPSLFRARRAVVSGDEKQLPPTRFFGAQLESEDTDELTETANEEMDYERNRLRDIDRREVKDCVDLLGLAQGLLPRATLEIHYRSKYRQLIEFSNAAFYTGQLSIPARHPRREIERFRPIEIDRVNGIYDSQTNPQEAARVVARLQEIWRLPSASRPTIGVVTFNLKQTDLIQEQLEELAEIDEVFRQAWTEEQRRTRDGEDCGFFVKNLENVQGDERDWIIFSTTFGRDAKGQFNRLFGALGQSGGERRLNVAVTRACQKMVVVTSMPQHEISSWLAHQSRRAPSIPRDFLQAWLAYGEHLSNGEIESAENLLGCLNRGRSQHTNKSSAVSSPFAQQVAAFLRELGYEPVTATGDAFGLDFAVVDPRTGVFGLGIECDSPSHEHLKTARSREIWRPFVMKYSIPHIHRVWSRAWYHDSDKEKKRLREAVNLALG